MSTATPGATWRVQVLGGVRGWSHGVGPRSRWVLVPPLPAVDETLDAALSAALQPTLPRPAIAEAVDSAQAALAYWVGAIQHAARLPVFGAGRWMSVGAGASMRPDASTEDRVLVVPSAPVAGDTGLWALQWAMNVLFGTSDLPTRLQHSQPLLARLQALAPQDKNTWPFLCAAAELDIPWKAMGHNIVRYGWGSRQRLLRSTFTDQTSAIASHAARDKRVTARFLREAGLPVPDHATVADADAAVRAAAQLGYPVVIKPVDLDGGHGVAAALRDEDTLRRAFARAHAFGREVMVEKHVDGEDHRLMTFQGELIWAIRRQPGGVLGDGAATVEQLVQQLNADPRRGRSAGSRLRAIELDDEALELLLEQGLTVQSIPAAGQRVRLRRTANMNRGGTAEAVNDRVHPDNRELALQAAAALGLDIAGIDLLIPDIAVSWRSSGAGICEVNAQPQLGGNLQRHLHGHMLKRLLPGGGRIPLVVLFGDAAQGWADAVEPLLAAAGLRVGRADAQGAWLGARPLGRHPRVGQAAAALLGWREVDAVLVCLRSADDLTPGLPFDRCDALVLCGAVPAAAVEALTAAAPPRIWTDAGQTMAQAAAELVAGLAVPRPQSPVGRPAR